MVFVEERLLAGSWQKRVKAMLAVLVGAPMFADAKG